MVNRLFSTILLAFLITFSSCGNGTSEPDLGPEPDLANVTPTPVGCTPETCFKFFGHDVVFKRMGAGNKEKVVLCGGGVVNDLEQWRAIQPQLAAKYDVVSWDYLGWGRSAKPSARISMGTQGGVAMALLDHLGWDRAHFTCFSIGGTVCQTIGLEHPSRVVTLNLVDGLGVMTPPPYVGFPDQNLSFFAGVPGTGTDGTTSLFHLVLNLEDHVTQELVRDVIKGHLQAKMSRTYDNAFDNLNYGYGLVFPPDYTKFFDSGIPYNVQWTKDKALFWEIWPEAYKNIKGANIAPVIDNCGHAMIVDCPNQVAMSIIRWVDAHPRM